MTDETKDAAAAPDQPVDAAVVAVGDDLGVEAVAGIAVQGNQALIVAQFADMDSAKAAYYALVDAEAKRALDIDGVLVVNADYQGKVNIQKMTDHKTRTGFVWGAVAGAAIGLIFPPTILAGAVYAGVAGAAIGKARNVMMKSGVAEELAGVIAPGTSGIVALVSITAVDAVKADHPGRQGRQVGPGRRRDRGGRQGRGQGCRRPVGRLSRPRLRPTEQVESSGAGWVRWSPSRPFLAVLHPAESCGMGGHGDVMTEDPQFAGAGTQDDDDHSAPSAAQQAIERLVVGRTPGVRGDDPWAEAGRKVLRFHLARMFARVPGVIAGEDPEEVHAMRVAARRARAAWRVFGDGFERGGRARLSPGPARDRGAARRGP